MQAWCKLLAYVLCQAKACFQYWAWGQPAPIRILRWLPVCREQVQTTVCCAAYHNLNKGVNPHHRLDIEGWFGAPASEGGLGAICGYYLAPRRECLVSILYEPLLRIQDGCDGDRKLSHYLKNFARNSCNLYSDMPRAACIKLLHGDNSFVERCGCTPNGFGEKLWLQI